MKALTLIITIFLIGLTSAVILLPEEAHPAEVAPVQQELPLTRDNLLKLVNEERAKVGVAPLVIDDMLNTSAQWKADDMTTFDYRGHIKPNDSYNEALEYLKKLDNTSSDRCKYVSENLVWMPDNTALSPTAAIGWWVSSKDHYKAMIDPEYALTGFGIKSDLAVQHFCKP